MHDENPVNQHPYRLNPKYKEKVCEELDKMLIAGIIEPVEESDSICPMVVQEKKIKGKIWIFLDLRKLNDACVHDPFPMPFTDEASKMLVVKKCTLLQKDSQDITRSKSHQKIESRLPSLQNGALLSIQLCPFDLRMPL